MWLWCRPPLGGVNPRDSSWHPLMWKINVATRCHILRLKCTKFIFGRGSAPDPAGWAYSTPPDPLAEFKGPTSKEREGMVGEERGGKGKGGHPLVLAYTPDVKSWIKPWFLTWQNPVRNVIPDLCICHDYVRLWRCCFEERKLLLDSPKLCCLVLTCCSLNFEQVFDFSKLCNKNNRCSSSRRSSSSSSSRSSSSSS